MILENANFYYHFIQGFSKITMLLTLILRIVNLSNNLRVLISVANKNIGRSDILSKILFKSRKIILAENLAKPEKSKNHLNFFKSQKTILNNNSTYIPATNYLTTNSKEFFFN